jgi:hypothetical protein
LLFAAVLAGFVLFPVPGPRHWDGWMTATVLAAWHEVGAKELFFFAHPLVIPITKLFALLLPVSDTLLVGMVRECTFAALNAVLVYWLARALFRRRLEAVAVALLFTLPYEHWRLATTAEEKDVMLFFGLLVFLPVLHLRGWVTFQILHGLPRSALAALSGVALATAFAVHLENGLLVPWTVFAFVAQPGAVRDWRRDARELAVLLGGAGVLTVAFFFPLAWYGNGIRSADGVYRWLFEYHLSGEFLDLNYRFPDRVAQAFGAFRGYVVGGPTKQENDGLFALVGIAGAALAFARAFRVNRGVTLACGFLLLLLALHFFNYRQEPEAWAGASVVGLLVLALAMLGGSRKPWQLSAWLAAGGLLLAVDVQQLGAPEPMASAPGTWLERRFEAVVPETQVALAVDRLLPADALLLVDDRHLVNAFRVYSARRPIVLRYLDRDDAYFRRPDVALTVLSRKFYLPAETSAALRAQAGAGRPVFYVTSALEKAEALFPGSWQPVADLGFRHYGLHRYLGAAGAAP